MADHEIEALNDRVGNLRVQLREMEDERNRLRGDLAQALGMLDAAAIVMESDFPGSAALARKFTEKMKKTIGITVEVQLTNKEETDG